MKLQKQKDGSINIVEINKATGTVRTLVADSGDPKNEIRELRWLRNHGFRGYEKTGFCTAKALVNQNYRYTATHLTTDWCRGYARIPNLQPDYSFLIWDNEHNCEA